MKDKGKERSDKGIITLASSNDFLLPLPSFPQLWALVFQKGSDGSTVDERKGKVQRKGKETTA